MLKRVILTGAGTGVVAAIVLIYPLYVFMPGLYTSDWPGGSAIPAALLEALAVLIIGAGGGLAARWIGDASSRGRIRAGALAGALAGFVVYGLIGGAAAGVAASGPMFGLDVEEPVFLSNLANTLIGSVWWVHVAFWGLMATGALFGGLGGLVVPIAAGGAAAKASADDAVVLNVTAITAMLASALALWVSVAIFNLLPQSLINTARDAAAVLYLPAGTVAFWPNATLMVMFVFSHAATAATLRRVAEQGAKNRALLTNAMISGWLAVLLPVGLLIVILLISPASVLALYFLPGIIASLIVSASLFPFVRELRGKAQAASESEADKPSILLRRNILPVTLGSALGLAVPGFGTVLPVALNMVLIQIVLVGRYYVPEGGVAGLAEMIQTVYRAQAQAFGAIVVVSVVAPLLTVWVIGLIAGVVSRGKAAAPAATPPESKAATATRTRRTSTARSKSRK